MMSKSFFQKRALLLCMLFLAGFLATLAMGTDALHDKIWLCHQCAGTDPRITSAGKEHCLSRRSAMARKR